MAIQTQTYQMRDRVVTPPAVTPVDLAQVKAHLRITGSADDTYLDSLIAVAVDMAQEFTRRKFINTAMEGFLDGAPFQEPFWSGTVQGSRSELSDIRIMVLPWLPSFSVGDVSTFDEDDVETVYDPVNYRVDTVDQALPARVVLKRSATWPANLRSSNAIRVQWVAGYGVAAADVPPAIRQALLMLVSFLYENRGECCDSGECLAKSGAMVTLRTYRVLAI
jgi:hypothetical protein